MSSVLISGASRGIGRATALVLARRGHRVVATARDPRDLDGLPVDAQLKLDVTDQATIEAAVAAAGHVDALVSNAGETLRSPVEVVPVSEVERLFRLNALGALRLTQAFLPTMRARRSGHIVYVSSVLGRVAVPLLSAYAASKWALEAIAETLALEVSAFGVQVSVVEPGAVSAAGGASPPLLPPVGDPYGHLYADLATARGETIRPEDVAEAIADVIDDPRPTFRKPVGNAALRILSRRETHPDGEPFGAAAT